MRVLIPALNEGVYDRECLCKSLSHPSSPYHDQRCRPAPQPYGHLSPLQLTLTPSLDTWTILSRPVFSSQRSKIYTFRNHIKSCCISTSPTLAQRRGITLHKAIPTVNPPRFLVASRGESLRPTLSCHLHASACAVVRGGGTGIALPAVCLR